MGNMGFRENRTRNQMWQPPSPATATADHRDRSWWTRQEQRRSAELRRSSLVRPRSGVRGGKTAKMEKKGKKIAVIIASLPDPVVSRRQSVVLFRSPSSPNFLQSKQLFCHLHRSGSRSSKYFPVKSTCICFCQKSNMLLFIQNYNNKK